MEIAQIIRTPLGDLGFSGDFLDASTKMNFSTLQDILSENRKEIMMREGFTYRWLAELVEFLSARQLMHLLQPLPGSNVY